MNKYEIMFIVKTTMDEAKVKDTVESAKKLVETLKAKLDSFKEMGERKLAYKIKKEINGYYYVMNIEASVAAIKEIDRRFSLDESILRHLIIKLDEE